MTLSSVYNSILTTEYVLMDIVILHRIEWRKAKKVGEEEQQSPPKVIATRIRSGKGMKKATAAILNRRFKEQRLLRVEKRTNKLIYLPVNLVPLLNKLL